MIAFKNLNHVTFFSYTGDINMPNHDGKTTRHLVGKDANGTNDDMILYILHSVSIYRDFRRLKRS